VNGKGKAALAWGLTAHQKGACLRAPFTGLEDRRPSARAAQSEGGTQGKQPAAGPTNTNEEDTIVDLDKCVLEIDQQIVVKASPEAAFEGLIRQLTTVNAMPLKLERFPGGRWFRDLGDNAGHLWGFVQVIKPPTLLEIHGPMFMSYPVAGHVQFRVAAVPGGSTVTVRHRAFGLIEEAHRAGAVKGWQEILEGIEGKAS
jgi:hypothetical protein